MEQQVQVVKLVAILAICFTSNVVMAVGGADGAKKPPRDPDPLTGSILED